MSRVLPDDVIKAYMSTGLIPIRCAWSYDNGRGGCAIDALARHRGVETNELLTRLPKRYQDGFLAAWDADDPQDSALIARIKGEEEDVKRGFCDGILCRRAVEKTFSSQLFLVPTDTDQA
jgi:hypothetical protein